MERETAKRNRNMKVVCINNTKDDVKVTNLTLGKVYDSLNINKHRGSTLPIIVIVNDKGVKEWYNNELFISLDKWREIKLKELGIV